MRAVAGAGLLTLFFSEYFFFNEEPALALIGPAPPVIPILRMWAFYIGFVLVLCATLSAFRVRRWEGIVLAGCVFGWAVEGMVIPAVYEAVPISLFWTSVGWHMPVDVFLGLFGIILLLRQRWLVVLAGSVGLGCLWALWTTWLWGEPGAPSPDAFVEFTFFAGAVLILGAALLAPVFPMLWALPRTAAVAVAGVAVALTLIQGMAYPAGLAMLVCLISTCLWALNRTAGKSPSPSLPPSPAPALKALGLAPAPVVAATCYAALWEADQQFVTQDVILFLLFLSVCGFLWSLARAFTSA